MVSSSGLRLLFEPAQSILRATSFDPLSRSLFVIALTSLKAVLLIAQRSALLWLKECTPIALAVLLLGRGQCVTLELEIAINYFFFLPICYISTKSDRYNVYFRPIGIVACTKTHGINITLSLFPLCLKRYIGNTEVR